MEIESLSSLCIAHNCQLYPIETDESLFAGAPTSKQYPIEMYYRLLAPLLLPKRLERVLYLDPDILVINPLRPPLETDMSSCLFAAAPHTGKTELANSVNRVRLGTENDYYKSGVLLIDLSRGREEISPSEIFHYAHEHRKDLILPDQDILNGIYGGKILRLKDILWNYDASNYGTYFLRSSGQANNDWECKTRPYCTFAAEISLGNLCTVIGLVCFTNTICSLPSDSHMINTIL